MTYRVTRKFINGNLQGLTISQETTVPMKEGMVCQKPCEGGSGYVIVKVIKLEDRQHANA